jgi:hypothetical protein
MTTDELVNLKIKAEVEIEQILNQLAESSGAELTVNVRREYSADYKAFYPVKIHVTL